MQLSRAQLLMIAHQCKPFTWFRIITVAQTNLLEVVCEPRTLEKPADELVSADLFEKMKDNALLCPICGSVYVEPRIVKKCFHKFCKGCIEHYIWRV